MSATAGGPYICPKCQQELKFGNTGWHCGCPSGLSATDLRADCEAYLRENGWLWQRGGAGGWEGHGRYGLELGQALEVQWARDGIGGAS